MLIDDIKNGESERLEFKERPNVAIYDDRLEITSPGRLKRGVTVQKMLDGCSDCRNEALALALSYMNYIEDWGSGIPRVRKQLKSAGLRDLVLEDWPNAVRAIIYRRVETQNSADETVSETVNAGFETVNETVNYPNETVRVIANNPGLRVPGIMNITGLSRATTMRHIADVDNIEFRGAPKTGGYYMKDPAQ